MCDTATLGRMNRIEANYVIACFARKSLVGFLRVLHIA